MNRALVGNRVFSVDDYRRLSNEERARANPVCLECRIEVHPYGLFAPGVTPRFDHPNAPAGLDPLDDCSLANRSRRLRYFGKDELDQARGLHIRKMFFERENLARAYEFCLSCTDPGSFSLVTFRGMLRRADRINIWAYVGIEPWSIPHILLLLADFRTRRGVDFHFALVGAVRLSRIWRDPNPVSLIKLFSNSGKPFERMGYGSNPRPILETDISGVDITGMGSGMIRTLESYRGSTNSGS